MKRLNPLYIVALVFLAVWAAGYYLLSAGPAVHILIPAAVTAAALALCQGNEPEGTI